MGYKSAVGWPPRAGHHKNLLLHLNPYLIPTNAPKVFIHKFSNCGGKACVMLVSTLGEILNHEELKRCPGHGWRCYEVIGAEGCFAL